VLSQYRELLLAERELDAASEAYLECLQIAQDVGAQEFYALGKYGLAQIAASREDLKEARRQGWQSLAILHKIKHNKAPEVEEWFATIEGEQVTTPSRS
jgi:hypothetical protein